MTRARSSLCLFEIAKARSYRIAAPCALSLSNDDRVGKAARQEQKRNILDRDGTETPGSWVCATICCLCASPTLATNLVAWSEEVLRAYGARRMALHLRREGVRIRALPGQSTDAPDGAPSNLAGAAHQQSTPRAPGLRLTGMAHILDDPYKLLAGHSAAATSTTVAVHCGSGTGSPCSRKLWMW